MRERGFSVSETPVEKRGLIEEAMAGYYATLLDAMEGWDKYYNYKRPHSAIRYLVPADYYRGNPDNRIVERREKLEFFTPAR